MKTVTSILVMLGLVAIFCGTIEAVGDWLALAKAFTAGLVFLVAAASIGLKGNSRRMTLIILLLLLCLPVGGGVLDEVIGQFWSINLAIGLLLTAAIIIAPLMWQKNQEKT